MFKLMGKKIITIMLKVLLLYRALNYATLLLPHWPNMPGRVLSSHQGYHCERWSSSLCLTYCSAKTCAEPERGGQGENIGFLRNTGPDPLKITKLPSQHSMLGHHRSASETPLKWRFAGRPLMAH